MHPPAGACKVHYDMWQFISYVLLQKPLYARGRTLSSEVLADCGLTNFPVSSNGVQTKMSAAPASTHTLGALD